MRTLALALAVVGAAGCDSRNAISDPYAFPTPSSWQVARINGVSAPSDGDRVIGTVHFDGRELSGFGACNRYGGTYSAQQGGSVGNGFGVTGLSATEMYCGAALHPFEERMFDALRTVSSWRTEANGRLVLLGQGAEMELLPMLVAGGEG